MARRRRRRSGVVLRRRRCAYARRKEWRHRAARQGVGRRRVDGSEDRAVDHREDRTGRRWRQGPRDHGHLLRRGPRPEVVAPRVLAPRLRAAPEVGAPRVPPGESRRRLAFARRRVLGGRAYYCGHGFVLVFWEISIDPLVYLASAARVASPARAGVIGHVPALVSHACTSAWRRLNESRAVIP